MRKMKAGGILKCEIISVTGHRHERGLDPYAFGDENEQRFWFLKISVNRSNYKENMLLLLLK